ncbi:PRC-barrel domain-containing protein [Butyricicoccus pullicaecorum]|uniref:YlmC/YmxH family sporulation protein n=2 Tax=Butyricicoccus pullicaecorum TaxID=501571 RepID=R8W1K6_9FIRM|nr:YlmC/YmxH family sporulation protein [Butyricicoccus pullicaecorum]EOQ38406.1 YlmC/YmxH family sporulation protein [Butyricicoccus pullicaecorum 1.2]OUP57469.1 YlmC/YmxH family sporulation protein [Butyricicoccus pullicaecorum]SKA53945.1 sporulation protein, YlmC/YmxH family [Butyricicoccus pullicaecorum DSM 23266]
MRESCENNVTLSELRCREVINLCDGARMGYVSDIQFNPDSGQITALIVPETAGVLGLLGRGDDAVIPWESVEKIGEDIIFVRYASSCPTPRTKKWFSS